MFKFCPSCGLKIRHVRLGGKRIKNGGNKMKTVMIDGIEYRSVESKGKRAVVVVDRGWIFAGDVEENGDRIILSNAVWVFRWSSIGFNGVLSDPKSRYKRCIITLKFQRLLKYSEYQ